MEVFEIHAHQVGEVIVAKSRVYDEGVDDEDVAGVEVLCVVEGADDGAHKGLGDVHGGDGGERHERRLRKWAGPRSVISSSIVGGDELAKPEGRMIGAEKIAGRRRVLGRLK